MRVKDMSVEERRKERLTRLVQTLLPKSTLKHLIAASKHEGISVSAFVRRMILEWERTVYGSE